MGMVPASPQYPTTGHIVGDETFVDVELNSGSSGNNAPTSNGEAPNTRKSSLKGSSRLLRKKIVQKYGRNRLPSSFAPQRKYSELIDENVAKLGKVLVSNDDANTVSTQQNDDHYEENDDAHINRSTTGDDTMRGSTNTYSVNSPFSSSNSRHERNGAWFPVSEPGSCSNNDNIVNRSAVASNDHGRFSSHHVSLTFEKDDEEDTDQYNCHHMKGRPHLTSFNCGSNRGHSNSDHLQGKTPATEKKKAPKTLIFKHDDEANIRWQKRCQSVILFLAVLVIAMFAVATTVIHVKRHQATTGHNVTSSLAAKDTTIPDSETNASPNSTGAHEEPSAATKQHKKNMTESMLLSVLQSTSSSEVLSDESSPQGMALSWLRYDDYALMALEQMVNYLQRKGGVVSEYADGDAPPARMNDVNEVWLKGDNGAPSRTRAVDILLERYAMATLYFYTGGDDGGALGWKRSTNWLSQRHLCEWQGVVCTPELDLIVGIELADNFLTGELPPHELQALPRFLTKLDLGYNKIAGTVPSGIHQLKHLKELRLQSNSLTGEVPQSVCELQPFEVFSADCSGGEPQLVCTCCTLCFHEEQ